MEDPGAGADTKCAWGWAGGGSLADWAVRPRLPDVEGGANAAEPRPSLRRPVVRSLLLPSRETLRRGISYRILAGLPFSALQAAPCFVSGAA